MQTTIVGHTGFVGGVLRMARPCGPSFNTSNYRDLPRAPHGLLVCAGVSAAKWRANADPEGDLAGIMALWESLRRCSAERVVLVSTVDVYPEPRGVDEGDLPHGLPNHAYGRNRLALEEMVLDRFPGALVVRLPALFGPGLKKNALHDMMRGHMTESVDPESRFQWYGLDRLWGDMDRLLALPSAPAVVNLTAEPLRTGDVRDLLFPGLALGSALRAARVPPSYDVRSRHAGLLGGEAGYVEGRAAALARMAAFVRGAAA